MKLRIKYTMQAPVSHIGEVASTGSYFQTIKTSNGRLPIVTANSVRGVLRDNGAKVLLDIIGTKVNKEIFHILFSGGNLNGTMKEDVAKAKNIREHFPFISVFGGGLGDMIMAGKMLVGNLYPLCKETYEMLGEEETEISWKNLIGEIEYTRTDDGKNDTLAEYIDNPKEEKKAKASTQMRYGVQYLAQGTVFVQDIYLFDNVTMLEKGALFSAIEKWFKTPSLGGMAGKGFGVFNATTDFGISTFNGDVKISDEAKDYIDKYKAFVADEKNKNLDILESKK